MVASEARIIQRYSNSASEYVIQKTSKLKFYKIFLLAHTLLSFMN